MKTIPCPKCKSDVVLDLKKVVDFNGEVFRCSNCGFDFRFTKR